MSKFKVGDYVVGNAKADKYSCTRKDWQGEVTEVLSDGLIRVSPYPGSSSGKGIRISGSVKVNEDYFDLDLSHGTKSSGKTSEEAIFEELEKQLRESQKNTYEGGKAPNYGHESKRVGLIQPEGTKIKEHLVLPMQAPVILADKKKKIQRLVL